MLMDLQQDDLPSPYGPFSPQSSKFEPNFELNTADPFEFIQLLERETQGAIAATGMRHRHHSWKCC